MDVYIWHHNDLDGVTSAAFFVDFLTSRRGSRGGIITKSVDHSIGKDEWFKTKLPYPSIVLDYKFNPSAAIWIDHHQGQQQFVNPPRFLCDPESPSCCRLVWKWLYDNFGYSNDKWSDTVYWMDIIDSSNYISAKQFVECKEPPLKVNVAVYEKNSDPDFMERLLNLFLEDFTFERVLKNPEIQSLYVQGRKKQLKAIQLAKEKSKLFSLPNGMKVQIINLFKEDKSNEISYFSMIAFYLFPDVDVAITINDYNGSGEPTIGLSVNPFKKVKFDVDVSKIAKENGGGGHIKAAGFQSSSKTLKKDLLRVLSKLSQVS